MKNPETRWGKVMAKLHPAGMTGFFLLAILVIVGLSAKIGCVYQDSQKDSGGNLCGQEPCYEGPFDPPWVSGLKLNSPWDYQLTHDNRVLETDNILVFSDASEDGAKKRMGEATEIALQFIINLFNATRKDIGISDRSTKIRVYSARRTNKGDPRAFNNGFVMWAFDSYNNTPQSSIPIMIKHECTHVVQSRLGGSFSRIGAWFTEGLAEHIGAYFTPVTCWPEVDEWRKDADHLNPVSIRQLTQIPDYFDMSGQRSQQYYPLFGLAVTYLVDPHGHGKTLADIKHMFSDIRRGRSFATAFETHMGMSLQYYQDNFYLLMEAYLPHNCEKKTETRHLEFTNTLFEEPPVDRLERIHINHEK